MAKKGDAIKNQALNRQIAEIQFQIAAVKQERDKFEQDSKQLQRADAERQKAAVQLEIEKKGRQMVDIELDKLRESQDNKNPGADKKKVPGNVAPWYLDQRLADLELALSMAK